MTDREPAGADDPIPVGAELERRLRILAEQGAIIEGPGFVLGEWVPARTREDGVIEMGWYRFSAQGDALLGAVRDAGCIVPFDWPAWAQAAEVQRLGRDPALVAGASGGDLIRLLTALVRSERFGDGALAGAWESGVLEAIVRRARSLTGGRD